MSIGTAVFVLAMAIFGLLGVIRFVWLWHEKRRQMAEWRRHIHRTFKREV